MRDTRDIQGGGLIPGPLFLIISRIEGDRLEREIRIFQEIAKPRRLDPARRAGRVIEIQDRVLPLPRHRNRLSFLVHDHERRCLRAQLGLAVELREHLGVQQVQFRMHRHLARNEPGVGDVHGHAVVAHDLGIQVMVVDLQRDELPREGILAGFDEEVAFGVLHGDRVPGQCGEIFLQLGAQGLEAILLRLERESEKYGQENRQEPFHSSTPSGMKAE